jgi:hypothetical protein
MSFVYEQPHAYIKRNSFCCIEASLLSDMPKFVSTITMMVAAHCLPLVEGSINKKPS